MDLQAHSASANKGPKPRFPVLWREGDRIARMPQQYSPYEAGHIDVELMEIPVLIPVRKITRNDSACGHPTTSASPSLPVEPSAMYCYTTVRIKLLREFSNSFVQF